MTDMIAQVIVLLPSHTPPDARTRPVFHYAIPAKLAGKLQPGHFVLVPFGKHAANKTRLVSGIILCLGDQAPPGIDLKPIDDLLDPQPVVSETHLWLAQWMADYYLAPLCECVRSFAPPGQTIHSDLEYALVQTTDDQRPLTADQPAPRLGSLQSNIIALLRERGPLRTGQLDVALRRKNWQSAIKPLITQGIVNITRVLPLPRTRPNMVRFVELATPLAAITDSDLGRTEDTLQRRRRALEPLLDSISA